MDIDYESSKRKTHSQQPSSSSLGSIQAEFPRPSPSTAFLSLPDDGPFLFSSDTASSTHSISSNSPPNDWQSAWPTSGEAEALLDYSNPSLFQTGISPNDLHAFDMNMNHDYVVNMLSDPQFGIQPALMHPPVLLNKHELTLQTQMQSQMQPLPSTTLQSITQAGTTDDIIAAVKRMTGVTSAQIAGPNQFQFEPTPEFLQAIPMHAMGHIQPAALSIPGHSLPPPSSASSAPSSAPSPSPVAATPQVGPSGRPKTAHTTIERRYRNNLNTCIVGLRNAIPAVRFLDKSYKSPTGQSDTPDANGCIDGVKCARKISKATILAKAREYISVLKKRESRLQRELDGMKDLMKSLVGGGALLNEWERHWQVKMAAEDAEDQDSNEDMESGDDDDDEGSDDERPKKRVKSAAAPPAAKGKASKNLAGQQVSEASAKPPRKRARNGAVKNSPTSAQPTDVSLSQLTREQSLAFSASIPQVPQQQQNAPAYLLASFVFLSFFKPSSSVHYQTQHAHNESGTVLSPLRPHAAPTFLGFPTDGLFHLLHTVVTLGVFIALAVGAWPSIRAAFNSKVNTPVKFIQEKPMTVGEDGELEDEQVIEKVSEEVRTELLLLAEEAIRKGQADKAARRKIAAGLEATIKAKSTATELGVLALLEYPISTSRAEQRWNRARTAPFAHANPASLAFELPLSEALSVLSQPSELDSKSPLLLIASHVLESRIEKGLQRCFIDEVDALCSVESQSEDDEKRRRDERKELTVTARRIGGRCAWLVEEWEVAMSGRWPKNKALASTSNDLYGKTSATTVLHALGLIKRIFPHSSASGGPATPTIGTLPLPTPPPSPLLQEELGRMERELRVTLGDNAFYQDGSMCGEVGRARDAVISRLSQVVRMRRSLAVDGWE